MLSELTGTPVTCVARPRPALSAASRIYGICTELPEGDTILIRADLSLIASVATTLAPAAISCHAKQPAVDGTLRDAMHTVFAGTSTLLSGTNRVVLKSMCTDSAHLTGPARSLLNFPTLATAFQVSVPNGKGGELAIFSGL